MPEGFTDLDRLEQEGIDTGIQEEVVDDPAVVPDEGVAVETKSTTPQQPEQDEYQQRYAAYQAALAQQAAEQQWQQQMAQAAEQEKAQREQEELQAQAIREALRRKTMDGVEAAFKDNKLEDAQRQYEEYLMSVAEERAMQRLAPMLSQSIDARLQQLVAGIVGPRESMDAFLSAKNIPEELRKPEIAELAIALESQGASRASILKALQTAAGITGKINLKDGKDLEDEIRKHSHMEGSSAEVGVTPPRRGGRRKDIANMSEKEFDGWAREYWKAKST